MSKIYQDQELLNKGSQILSYLFPSNVQMGIPDDRLIKQLIGNVFF